jgi:predicted GIY-YIG superfamily endonuclease
MTYSEDYMTAEVCLYRLFDNEGMLLYIGLGADVESRVATHAATKTWGKAIDRSRTTSEPVGIRASAFPIEAEAIRTEKPLYNRQHNPARPQTLFGESERFTPVRTIRIQPALWNAAVAKAKANGTTLTAIAVRALENYTQEENEK